MLFDPFGPDFEQVFREIEEARRAIEAEWQAFMDKMIAAIQSSAPDEESEMLELDISLPKPERKLISRDAMKPSRMIPWYTSGFT